MGYAARSEPTLQFDDDGFVIDPQSWTEDIAEWIAHEDGIEPLTDEHWRVIHHLRERYLRLGALPVARLVCRANRLERNSIQTLFKGCRRAWRISGLPNPGEEAKAYM